ncbi:Hypothetical_protein [Hexamita inflata]|uniref:Hypothetical_protein n=1 Tax=Hexamita inflata TaxID=28002 RepID=A0AA86NXH6_9EUKA|nr:Hypothetical protein HINF_LOCUS14154 [Hexamita inflata]
MQLMDEMTPERMIVQLKLSLQISMEKQNQYLLQIENLQQELLQHCKLSKNEQLIRTVKNAIILQNDLNIQKDQCDQLRLQLEQQFVQSNALHKLHKTDLKTIEGQLLQIQQIELQKENQINELHIQLNKQESQIQEIEIDKQRLALQQTQNENNYEQQIKKINQINENQLSQFKKQQFEQSQVFQVKIFDLQNQITEYTVKLEQNLQQSVLLKEESKQLKIQISQQNIQIQDLQNEYQALKLQLAQLQTELAQNKNTMISMESTLLQLRNENVFLQSELSENNRSFKQTINQQESQFTQFQTDLESKITLLNTENESLNNNITNLNNQLITSNNKTSELQNYLNISNTSLEELTLQLQIIKNDKSLQITVTELQTEQQQNQSIITSLHEQLESKTLQINQLNDQIIIQQLNLINIQHFENWSYILQLKQEPQRASLYQYTYIKMLQDSTQIETARLLLFLIILKTLTFTNLLYQHSSTIIKVRDIVLFNYLFKAYNTFDIIQYLLVVCVHYCGNTIIQHLSN